MSIHQYQAVGLPSSREKVHRPPSNRITSLLLVVIGSAAVLVVHSNHGNDAATSSVASVTSLRPKHRVMLAESAINIAPEPASRELEEQQAYHQHRITVDSSMLDLGKLVKKTATSLAGGALSKIGGEAMGWVLKMVGLDSSDDSIPQGIDEIKQELAVQKEMLHDIQNGLKQLEKQISAAVEEIVSAIEDAHDKTRFLTWVATLNQNVGVLLGFSDSLRVWSEMEPSNQLDADIQEFRSAILNNVPGAIRSIDGALMGSGFSEGMIAMFARIQFKESSSIDDYAQSFYLMYQYYYSYEVLGLQLMMEAYHAAPTPNYKGVKAYYAIWQGIIGAQTEEYMKSAPMSSQVDSWQADPTNMTIGEFRLLQITPDRAYFYNLTGYIHSTALDGSDARVAFAGLGIGYGFFNTYQLFQIYEGALYVGGCTNKFCGNGIVIQKYDLGLKLLGQATIPPVSGANQQEPRGYDFADSRLYVLQFAMLPNTYYSSIQVVELGGASTGMTYKPEESVTLSVGTLIPGDLKMASQDMAVMGINMAQAAWIVNTTSKEQLAMVDSSGSYTSKTGITLTFRTDSFPSERLYLDVLDGATGLDEYSVLRAIPYNSEWRHPQTWRFTEMSGNFAYTIAPEMSNYTLVDSKATLQLPFRLPLQGYTAVDVADGFLYIAGGSFATVIKYDVAYPFAYPEDLVDP